MENNTTFTYLLGAASPVVALLAIFINNNRAKKRDKENQRNQLFYSYLDNVLKKLVELEYEVTNAGKLFIEYQENLHSTSSDELFAPFMEHTTKLQMDSHSITSYGNIVYKIVNSEENFDALRNEMDNYVNGFTSLMKYHDELASEFSPDEVLDKVQQKLSSNDEHAKNVIYTYIDSVTTSIERLVK